MSQSHESHLDILFNRDMDQVRMQSYTRDFRTSSSMSILLYFIRMSDHSAGLCWWTTTITQINFNLTSNRFHLRVDDFRT